jgi:hypothetical protein
MYNCKSIKAAKHLPFCKAYQTPGDVSCTAEMKANNCTGKKIKGMAGIPECKNVRMLIH